MYSVNLAALILFAVIAGESLFILLLIRKKAEHGALALAFFALLFILSDLSYAMENMALTDSLRTLWFTLFFVISSWMPVAELHLVNRYFNLRMKTTGAPYLAFIGLSILFSALILLQRYHGYFVDPLLFRSDSLFVLEYYRGGVVLKLLYLYRLAGASFFLFVCYSTMIKEKKLYKTRALLLSFMVVIPMTAIFFSSLQSNIYRLNVFPFVYLLGMLFPQYLYAKGVLFGPVPPDTDLIMESLSDGVLILGHDDIILDYNSKLSEFCPDLNRSIIGRGMEEAGRSVHLIQALNTLSLSDKGELLSFSGCAQGERVYEVRRLVQTGSNLQHISALVVRDVTALRKMRAELEATYEDIAEADRLKTMVLSVISRYERAPLAMLKGLNQLMCSPRVHKDPEQIAQVYDEIDRLIDRNEILIANLLPLDIMHRSKGAYSVSAVDCSEIISSLSVPLKRLAFKKRVRLQINVDDDVLVLANRDLLRNALHNIAENAIRFSPPGAVVSVRQTIGDADVSIVVNDEGVGIDADSVTFFENGQWGNSRMGTSGESGPGIGLYATKKFMQWIGGSIHVEKKADRGTQAVLVVRRAFPRQSGV